MIDNRKVLIVDDEPNAVKVLSVILRQEGYQVRESMSVDSAMDIMHGEDVDAVITDLKMPAKDGFHLFNYVSEHHPYVPVMFLTAYGTVESAVQAMTSGACYYFIKPPDYPKLKCVLARAIDERSAQKKFESLKKKACGADGFYSLIGKTPAMEKIMSTVDTIADSNSSVLIQGDTGTGKEVVARNLHFRSKRCDKPFVAVNCAAIPRELIESELFGYEKGAFTGASASRMGKFEEAMHGTVLLDEIGELDLPVQAKLLRVLQEREIERLGTNKKLKVDFRLLSSTNRDLRQEVAAGRFREDLFYRINVVQIDIPELRDHKEDIPLLAEEFLKFFSLRENRPLTFSDEVMDIFMSYDWPGNIRQLKNVIERSVVLARGEKITSEELPDDILGTLRPATSLRTVKPLKMLEHQAIAEALHIYKGNKSKAARTLGISRKAFYKRLKEM